MIKKNEKKKAWDLGSSRNHLSSFIRYTFNTKIFIYPAFGNQDKKVLYEPSDRRCSIGVNGLSYSNSYRAKKKWSLGNYQLPAASITKRGEDCNRMVAVAEQLDETGGGGGLVNPITLETFSYGVRVRLGSL